MMNELLQNRKFIITGASGGLGERFAWHIARNGGIPIVIARSYDILLKNQELMLEAFGVQAIIYESDLSTTDGQEIFLDIIEEHGPISGLINNAGIGMFESVLDVNFKSIRKMFELNVFSVMKAVEFIYPHFIEHGKGHIVNIVSQAGKIATPKSSSYVSSKHAILGYSNVLRQEAANYGINVMTVNLGPVATNFFEFADPSGKYANSVAKYMLDPDVIAIKVVKHLMRKKREINMPWWMEIGSKFYAFAPSIMERALKSQFNKK